MRKSRVIALVVASLVSSASFAQAQSSAPVGKAGRHEMRGGMKGERGRGFALRGLKLSDAEKASVRTIHAKYAAEGRTLRQSLKPAMQEARAARQKGDTAAVKAVWERNAGARAQVKALRDREQAEIRSALTPENQKAFDARLAKRAARHAEWAKQGGPKGKGGHHGRHAGTNG